MIFPLQFIQFTDVLLDVKFIVKQEIISYLCIEQFDALVPFVGSLQHVCVIADILMS